ncbi:MAG: cupin domain-containing protein [Opitutales bacterium]
MQPESLPSADTLIARLNLEPLPQEGGFFRQAWKSETRLAPEALPVGYGQEHPAGTAIYFLVTQGPPTAVHRLVGTEVYHHYLGDPVRVHRWSPHGVYDPVRLGPPVDSETEPQRVVPPLHWQAVQVLSPGTGAGFALMGTTLAPGFVWEDVVFADEATLRALGKPEKQTGADWVSGLGCV